MEKWIQFRTLAIVPRTRRGKSLVFSALSNYQCKTKGWWHLKISRLELRSDSFPDAISWPAQSWPSTLDTLLKPLAETPQIAHTAAFLKSNTICHRTSQLLLSFISELLPRAVYKSHVTKATVPSGCLSGCCALTSGCFFGLPLFLFRPSVGVGELGFTGFSLLMMALPTGFWETIQQAFPLWTEKENLSTLSSYILLQILFYLQGWNWERGLDTTACCCFYQLGKSAI